MAKPVESLSPLGQHIRRYRRANRYSLKQLSEVAGISKVQLWELETAESPNPRLSTLVAVARATNTTLARVATLAATQPAGAVGPTCNRNCDCVGPCKAGLEP